ncbi:hypothetical protein SCHPADRAFT_906858 [Schizopora paradoxa]|uniref:Uncharacterized protein n=1 Tax=Schizopora paradoxa TaxID=27342 RepID=A0A0H2RG08_9AGAM|nr:hypothetical protein SCHPADRAFT_906858 [Schizopora paradoxa]
MCDISNILDNLSPILIINAPNKVVGFTHPYYTFIIRFPVHSLSFEALACQISPEKQNLRLARACLRFMKISMAVQADERQKSMASYHSVNACRAEDGVPTNVSEALKYACSSWMDHMNDIWRPGLIY